MGVTKLVASIAVNGLYKIGIKNNKIKLKDGKTLDIREMPFMRYKFEEYGDKEIEYIKDNIKNFPCVHIADVIVDENIKTSIEKIVNSIENIGILIYIRVTDEVVKNGIGNEVLNTVKYLRDNFGDRIDEYILKDESTMLNPAISSEMQVRLSKYLGVRVEKIGVCGGPCCFISGNACLTAVKAREIMAKRACRTEVVPSSNHEVTLSKVGDSDANACGCIRFHTVDCDLDAPESKNQKSIEKSEESTSKSSESNKNKSKNIKKKPKGQVAIKW